MQIFLSSFFFFFNDTATTEIYTLSLHDALPILLMGPSLTSETSAGGGAGHGSQALEGRVSYPSTGSIDRKSTRLNSSHANISYAVFCLKKKNKHHIYSFILQYKSKLPILFRKIN